MKIQSPIIKTSKPQFEKFQDCFIQYQKIFNLQDYVVVFDCSYIDGNFGHIRTNSEARTAFVTLTDKIHKNDKEYFDVNEVAKHECIHLLLSDLTYIACERFGNLDTLKKEEEKVVRLLTKLIR